MTCVERCSTKVCTAVRNSPTATPASSSVAAPEPNWVRAALTAPASDAMATPASEPMKAATGTTFGPRPPRYTIAIVAPSPAPAEAPSIPESTSGLRNTPWYPAPATDSSPPTSAPATIRGSLIWNSTAWSTADRLVGRWTNGILSSSAAAVANGFRSAAPTSALTSAAAIRKTTAAPSTPAFLTPAAPARSPGRSVRRAAGGAAPTGTRCHRSAGSPHLPHRQPAGPPGDHGGGLPAVAWLVVGEEDELRPGRDDELLGHLRVAGVRGLVGGVGDVLQAEHPHDLAD